jgi:hypothetical protein
MQLRVSDADLIRRPIHCNGGLIATLVERIDRRPIRPVATGRRNRPVGMYPSVKCGRAEPWESRVELHALHHAEVNTETRGKKVARKASSPKPMADPSVQASDLTNHDVLASLNLAERAKRLRKERSHA